MADEAPQRTPKRVVSGMRPTGRMHLGHFHGALKNWIAVSQKAECYFFSADWHALTTDYKDPSRIAASQREMFADWIAAGLDPARCTFFIQSQVKQHAELFLLLGMVTPIGWLERVPTYKELQEQLREKDLANYGFLGYPALQTADGKFVPELVIKLRLAQPILTRCWRFSRARLRLASLTDRRLLVKDCARDFQSRRTA